MYPFPALLTPLPVIPFTTEEMTGCTNEAAKGANKTPRNRPSCFFISCFTVSVMSSNNTSESSSDFTILTISFISSFKMNKVNSFPSLTVPFRLTFLSNLLIAFKVTLLTNPDNLSLAKGIATFVSGSFPKLPNQEAKELFQKLELY